MRRSLSGIVCLAGAAVLAWGQAGAQGFDGYQQAPPHGGGMGDGNPFLGAWTSRQPGQGGMVVSTAWYKPDGTYVVTSHLPNDTLTRTWGQYRVQQVGPDQWQMDSRITDFLPRQVCIQVMGGARNCTQVNAPVGGQSSMTRFNGPSVMLNTMGETWQRDPQPVLLQVQVPAVGVQVVASPPMVVGPTPPVTPVIRPYDSRGAQDFIHQRLRGCSPDPGTLHSYTICDQVH